MNEDIFSNYFLFIVSEITSWVARYTALLYMIQERFTAH